MSKSEIKGQSYRTGFSDTLPWRDRTMLLLASAKPIAIGRRCRHCYKYRSVPRPLPRTDLALLKAWQSSSTSLSVAYRWWASGSGCISWRRVDRSSRYRTVCHRAGRSARWPATYCNSRIWSTPSASPSHGTSALLCRLSAVIHIACYRLTTCSMQN